VKLSNGTARATEEWVAKHPDQRVPGWVKLRVFLRADRRCHISGKEIGPLDQWEVEHVKPLSMGGEHRESNLAPALIEPHKKKTKQERKEKARADHQARGHYGIDRPKQRIPYRLFDGTPVPPRGRS
jgi:5-methylcytosine-specific restriction protein A